jgi:hypothetical protein
MKACSGVAEIGCTVRNQCPQMTTIISDNKSLAEL